MTDSTANVTGSTRRPRSWQEMREPEIRWLVAIASSSFFAMASADDALDSTTLPLAM